MPRCTVKLPFGDEIVAEFEVDYLLDGKLVDEGAIDPKCIGFYVGRLGSQDRRCVSFDAKAGPEVSLRDRFAEAALAVWRGRILDLCQQHAEENRLSRC